MPPIAPTNPARRDIRNRSKGFKIVLEASIEPGRSLSMRELPIYSGTQAASFFKSPCRYSSFRWALKSTNGTLAV
jgi:hypothetical protein